MHKLWMVLSMTVRRVGKRIEHQVSHYLRYARWRLSNLRKDLPETVAMYQTRSEARTRSLNLPAWLTSWMVSTQRAGLEAGYSVIGVLLGAAGVILGVVVFVTKGVPVIFTMSSNTTAFTDAGVDTTTVQYWTWGMWVVVLIVIIGTVILIVKKYGIGVGGGGGGGGRSRRRR